ncbi:MAG: FKBP-type peptidyl-prolyl cis-trans isomerase [Sterolibacterium sp.]|jgi:FKBP-type peptidyl-prolyl cis-trans isomerase SlpA
MSERVKRDSLVTLHYRVASGDGAELLGTFDATPATLQLGSGELAPPLEACLEGLPVGQRQVFVLGPQRAFGMHNPQLVRRIPRAELPHGTALEALSLIEFSAPTGARLTGLVCELDEQAALIDFNHPLAGKSIRFEVEVIGIL